MGNSFMELLLLKTSIKRHKQFLIQFYKRYLIYIVIKPWIKFECTEFLISISI